MKEDKNKKKSPPQELVPLEVNLAPFSRTKDLKVPKHEKLITNLEKQFRKIPHDLFRFNKQTVRNKVLLECERVRQAIQSDISEFRIKIKAGERQFAKIMGRLNEEKNSLIERARSCHFQDNGHIILSEMKAEFNVLDEQDKARQQDIINIIKLKKHEREEFVFEQLQGRTPVRRWFNR
ncbi:MAG: hypothetical protein RIC35_02590 [Marinoscillum sp.]